MIVGRSSLIVVTGWLRPYDANTMRTIVIVEGDSDKEALEALARLRERDLEAEGVSIVPIGGAHAISRFMRSLEPADAGVRLAGLVDAGEERAYKLGLERFGRGSALDRVGMERLGFFVCSADLEDELIRTLGPERVQMVIHTMGDLQSWQTFQKQLFQRGRPIEAQLRRFMGTTSGRKAAYTRALVEALAHAEAVPPLDRLLAHI
jgi:hypothetical protein